MCVCEMDLDGPCRTPCRTLSDKFGNTRHGVWDPSVAPMCDQDSVPTAMVIHDVVMCQGKFRRLYACMHVRAHCDWSALDSNASSVGCGGNRASIWKLPDIAGLCGALVRLILGS